MPTKTWNTELDNWDTRSDWSPAGVPKIGDDVVIHGDVHVDKSTGAIAAASISLDDGSYFYVEDGSGIVAGDVTGGQTFVDGTSSGTRLTIGGTLSTDANIGNKKNTAAGTKTLVTAGALGVGLYHLTGGASSGGETRLRVKSVAGVGGRGVLDGKMSLSGNSLVAFGSGQITSIPQHSSLGLVGASARVADISNTTSNSALVGLSEVGGLLDLERGAELATGGDLEVSNVLLVDRGGNGSQLSVAGTLTNDGAVIDLGNTENKSTARTVVSVGDYQATAGSNARLELQGGAADGNGTVLHVHAATTGVLDFDASLSGNSLLVFKSGQIDTIAAAGRLSLSGPGARVADVADTTSNSALTGLSEVDGFLSLLDNGPLVLDHSLDCNGAYVSIANSQFVVDGDLNSTDTTLGLSDATVTGTLTNIDVTGHLGSLIIDGSAGTDVSLGALVNSSVVNLFGTKKNAATLDVTGATSGNGNGLIRLSAYSTLSLEGGVSGQELEFQRGSAIAKIGMVSSSTFSVSGFTSGNVFDLEGEVVTHLSYNDPTLTLTLSDGTTQTIDFTGQFKNLTYHSDGNGGTDIVTGNTATSAAEPDAFAAHAAAAQDASLAAGAGPHAGGGTLHASFAEMMAHVLGSGSGATPTPSHDPMAAAHGGTLAAAHA